MTDQVLEKEPKNNDYGDGSFPTFANWMAMESLVTGRCFKATVDCLKSLMKRKKFLLPFCHAEHISLQTS